MTILKRTKRISLISSAIAFIFSTAYTPNAIAVDYPENIDYGTQGDFIIKRGTEFGRTAILMPVGPILINLPEGPGTTSDTFQIKVGEDEFGEDIYTPTDEIEQSNRARDTAWDLSDLTNPTLFRQLTCDTSDCNPGQPIAAHATMVRYDDDLGPILYGRNSGDLSYHLEHKGTDAELTDNENYWSWGYDPISYTHMTAPYYIRKYWQYDNGNDGQFLIRDTTQILTGGPNNSWTVEGNTELEALFGSSQLGIWLGEPVVGWDHLGDTGVTGFTTWLGNLLVVASDQQSTGLAIYDASGYKEGRIPRLLSVYDTQRTEPSGNNVGVGGYWMEAYGTTKMVFSARARDHLEEEFSIVPLREKNGLIIVDFVDPTNPYVSCELFFDQDENDPSDGDGSTDPMYVNFQDHYAYLDHFKVDMDLCEQHFDDGIISDAEFDEIVYKFEDIANGCDSSQYFRPIGQVGIFGGYDWWETRTEYDETTFEITKEGVNEQGMCFFVTSDEPDTNAPYIAGHRPLANQEGIPIDTFIHLHIPETLRTETLVDAISVTNKATNAEVSFRQQLAHTGIISIWPDDYLSADSTYEVSLTGIQDFMGNTMVDYSFEFTTNDGDLLTGETPATPAVLLPTSWPTETGKTTPTTPEPFESYYPNKSSQISCSADDHSENIWVVNPDNDTIALIATSFDSATLSKSHHYLKELKLNYEAPTSIAKDNTNSLHAVTYRDDDKVVFFDSDGLPKFTIDTGHGTQPISVIADDGFAYVALYASGELIKIDIANKNISSRLYLGFSPKAMALQDDRLLVTRFISAKDNGEVFDVNTAGDMTLIRTIIVNKVEVADDLDHGSGVPNYLRSIVIDSTGEYAYITANKANTDRGTSASSTNPHALDDDNTVRSIIVTLDLVNNVDANTDATTRANASDLDNVSDPSGVTYLANPAVLAVALQGNNLVIFNNKDTNTTARITTGSAPQEMCSNLRTLYVKNFTDRTVSAIDVTGFLDSGDISPNVETISSVQNETLPADELTGLQLFYHSSMPEMGQEGYMSCASCHDGGGHDGRTWDITSLGEGLRNTLSLNGASGTRFGNLHWSGNFDEVQDFELQIERLNGGNGLVGNENDPNNPVITFGADDSPLTLTTTGLSDDLDALAAYVNGLGKDRVKRSPYRDYNGDLSESAQRGQTVFTDKNCASCHSSAAFRDGQMHDVGTITADSGNRLGETLTAIRTPSLIELWDSAPYLHNGVATSLEQVLDSGTDANHKVTLTTQEKADLVQYLLSIDRELYIDDE